MNSENTVEVVAMSVFDQLSKADLATALSVFKDFDWGSRFSSDNEKLSGADTCLTFSTSEGNVLQIKKSEGDKYSLTLGLESEKKLLGLFPLPERHTAKFDNLPKEKVEEAIEVYFRSELSGVLDWIENTRLKFV